jgi:hypothetical protein
MFGDVKHYRVFFYIQSGLLVVFCNLRIDSVKYMLQYEKEVAAMSSYDPTGILLSSLLRLIDFQVQSSPE